ncbi:Lysophospholipase 1 [Pseudogymnoascus verrucosus]|uniref:Lysophospholipase n=1 Tax=Pseudogymnoascus verrucosus TaxID=342668 RepID=A0A1B8GAM0_9PEZI|nr:Lysophospholipase 1 [Pseudogymnoascus verrucosus]OBT92870.1 Lysophospholipase 1 [Pseudogymnoascus verrucosus]
MFPGRSPMDVVAVVDPAAANLAAWKRATMQAPNNYAPAAVDCPSTRPTIRLAGSLSDNETAWLEVRRNNTIWAMRNFLGRANITGLDTNAYIDNIARNASELPNIGIAISGGGYRALMNGAGALAAFDNRTTNSTNQGQLGGLLQATTYLTGLSGGSWLVGSLYVNNFTSVQDIINTGSLWQFDNSILKGPTTLSTTDYYNTLYNDVNSKADAGFNTTITDYWGLSLSFQLVNPTNGGPAYTFSSIADDPGFAAANEPMPIIVADERAPGQLLIPANTTIYEFNPWEIGTFDPTTFGFAPLRYVGSNFSGGVLPPSEACVRGVDNAGFVMGTSSSLFNQLYLTVNATSGVSDRVRSSISNILQNVGESNSDIADWPNPFYGYNNKTNLNSQSKSLTLVDGGEDLQNIPLHPLLQPIRHVDIIFAVDASADTSANWPNGTAMVASFQRSLNTSLENGTVFPSIPDQNTFINLGLNTRPTFFGCNASNMTGPSPLIVYLPNHPYVYYSNVSTFDLSYNNTERNNIIQNGYDVATMGNGTVDEQWPTCVGCAILSRSLSRTGTNVPDVCAQCFNRYCWNGTVNSTTPAPYEPITVLK